MKLQEKQLFLLISISLVIATLIAYEPIRHNGFVSFDDHSYVTENPNVSGGITQRSIIWAFTKYYASNWHPLTWLSHMMDCELYGLKPLGHHITNLIIHIANSLFLFLMTAKMTGKIWSSVFVAAAFALHPLHVESVAWVSERKDVLSGFFWMLTILAYIHYVKRPGATRYMLILLFFILGLMSKPMLVTLPFVLILLDYWPLHRIHNMKLKAERRDDAVSESPDSQFSILNSVIEKIPFFVLSAVSCAVTLIAQKRSGTVVSLSEWPLHIRVVNALGSYFKYIVKMAYPKNLAILYPIQEKISVDAALLAVVGIIFILVMLRRGRPWLFVGLLWYLVTLLPVIGLVQTGSQMMADRYTYIPSIGIFIIIAWCAEEITVKKHIPKTITAAVMIVLLIVMVLLTRIQTGYWKNTTTLFGRAVAVIKNNYVMLDNLGRYLVKQGNYEDALRYFKEAVRVNPDYILAKNNLCATLLAQNKTDEAIDCFNEALQKEGKWPDIYKIYFGLGLAYEKKGDFENARLNYKKTLSIAPDFEPANKCLESLLLKQGKNPKQ
ncbi:MAG: tetratricopeptide repeat protein [Sedimentisphaerales bacterium]|nr:tetratricopeptide repeat protein [Sedimentisphaerales bacterium]